MKLDRFWLFCYDTYYPRGGMADLVGSYPTLLNAVAAHTGENWHVVDIETGVLHLPKDNYKQERPEDFSEVSVEVI